MPMNMKMPIIKVTPSSPSPDPNHPDYPEFFEDKLYLEHVSKIKKDQESEEKDSNAAVSFDSFTLVLDPDDSDEEENAVEEKFTLTPQKSSLKMRRQNSIYESSTEVFKSPPNPDDHGISIDVVDSNRSASQKIY